MEKNSTEENTTFPAPLIFNEIIEVLRRFVYFKEYRYYLLFGVYPFLTHLFHIFERIPHIFILGQGDCSGSIAGKWLSIFCFKSQLIGWHCNSSEIYRFIKQEFSTLFFYHEGLRSIDKLNLSQLFFNGNKKAVSSISCNGGKTIKPFSTFGPMVLIAREGINGLTIEREGIKVQTQKSPFPLQRLFLIQAEEEFKGIKNEIEKFCKENKETIENEYYNFPRIEGLEGNDEELWMPLLSIAKVLDQLLNKTNFIVNQLLILAKDTIRAREEEKFFSDIETHCLYAVSKFIDKNNPTVEGLYVGEIIRDGIRSQSNLQMETKRIVEILQKYGAIQYRKRKWVNIDNGKEIKRVMRTCYSFNREALYKAIGNVSQFVN
jgi:hypothetical protein